MNALGIFVAGYLSVGFAKFVLDISRLPFFYELIGCVDLKLAEERGVVPGFRARLLLAVALGLTVQAWLVWPQILLGDGLMAFVQPISREKAGEIVGAPFGLAFDFKSE